MQVQYSNPVASITTDCVIFGFKENRLNVLLIKRAFDPEKDKWSLPGGFMEKEESLENCAQRILHKLTGVSDIYLEQFQVFSKIDRHPIDRVITAGFYALVNPEKYPLNPSWFASEAYWCEVDRMPSLAFDHQEIFEKALNKLKINVRIQPIGFELLSEKFTMKELQNLYEAILNRPLDRRNFRKKIKTLGILIELNEFKKGAHKDAMLYRFVPEAYKKLEEDGFAIIF